ncbi:MAG: exodeoxyribonuclease VII small subunit [Isosphaeraceae bacterium]
MPSTPQTDPDVPFEEALRRLERLVDDLERGEPELSTALAKYEQGVRLLARCQGAGTGGVVRRAPDGGRRRGEPRHGPVRPGPHGHNRCSDPALARQAGQAAVVAPQPGRDRGRPRPRPAVLNSGRRVGFVLRRRVAGGRASASPRRVGCGPGRPTGFRPWALGAR